MLGYAEEETFQVLEMPYAGRELSMVVLLPKKADGLPELEKSISVERLGSLMPKLRVREVNAYLPKFKLEASFDLNKTLERPGHEAGILCGGRLFGHQRAKGPLHLRRDPQGIRGRQRGGHRGGGGHGGRGESHGSSADGADPGLPGRSPVPVLDPRHEEPGASCLWDA